MKSTFSTNYNQFLVRLKINCLALHKNNIDQNLPNSKASPIKIQVDTPDKSKFKVLKPSIQQKAPIKSKHSNNIEETKSPKFSSNMPQKPLVGPSKGNLYYI